MGSAVSTHDSRRATQVTLRAIAVITGLLLCVLVGSFLLSDRSGSELQQARKRVAALETEIKHLEEENAQLHSEIESVKKSTFAVERIAREDLSMSKPGEVVYMLPVKK